MGWFWGVLGCLGAVLGCLGAILGRLGAVLGRLGAVLRRLVRSSGGLAAVLVRSWRVLGVKKWRDADLRICERARAARSEALGDPISNDYFILLND